MRGEKIETLDFPESGEFEGSGFFFMVLRYCLRIDDFKDKLTMFL